MPIYADFPLITLLACMKSMLLPSSAGIATPRVQKLAGATRPCILQIFVCQSKPFDIPGSKIIAVMLSSTSTSPCTVRERQFSIYRPAGITSPAARFKPADLQQVLTTPFCFVLQLPKELAPRNIRNGLSKATVLHHPCHAQVFYREAVSLVFTGQQVGQLVQEIVPPVAYFLVEPCHLQDRLLSIGASPLFLAGPAL